jgi:Zn-dependent peptidase ImmA (M78 family)
MTTSFSPSLITEVVQSLYKLTDVSLPTSERCIVPLSELLDHYGNLVCVETQGLSSRLAVSYLLGQGALVDIPGEIEVSRAPLAGFLYATPTFGAIFVEQGDILVRRRFTVCHEWGHFLLHRPLLATSGDDEESFLIETIHSPANDEAKDEGEEFPVGSLTFNRTSSTAEQLPTFAQMEHEANQFAVELLMPALVVRAKVEEYSPYFRGEDLIWRLATEMLVSRAAIRYRLNDLRLLR